MNKKWLTPILPYLAIWAGLFLFKSAWFALMGFHFAILLGLFVLRPNIPINILIKNKHPKWVVVSVVICGSSGIGIYLLWNIFQIAVDLPAQLKSIGLNSSSWLLFIAYFSIINPFIEEYFWRGFLGSDAKKLHPSDFIYAGYHVLILWEKVHPLSILFGFICLVAAGWLWRQILREDTGLLAPVLGHMAADFSILICVMLQTA